MSFKITNLTKNNSPVSELFFVKIKNTILNKSFDLSLVFVGDIRAQKLNKEYRKKDYIPNTLSFLIDDSTGEIFLNLNQIKKETGKFNLSFKNLIIFMFIHSCLHLKKYEHGPEMEKKEKYYYKKFKTE